MSSSNSISDGLIGTSNTDNLEQGSGSPDLSSLAPASSNSGVAASSSSSSSSSAGKWFSRLTDLTNPYTWLAIVFIFALLGINIFMYLAQGTKDAAEMFRPLFFMISKTIAFSKINAPVRRILLYGTTEADVKKYGMHFEGVIPNLNRRWQTTTSEYVKARLHSYLSEQPCQGCNGARLRPEAIAVTVGGKSIYELTSLSVEKPRSFSGD